MSPMQIIEAVMQIRSHVQANVEQNPRDWEFDAIRGILYKLGYHGEDADTVIHTMYTAGFTHCIDPEFASKDGIRPSADACYWYPDQLLSRIPTNWAIEAALEQH